jgi:hypothetical protein
VAIFRRASRLEKTGGKTGRTMAASSFGHSWARARQALIWMAGGLQAAGKEADFGVRVIWTEVGGLQKRRLKGLNKRWLEIV